jgi:hypothetical protein
MRRLLPTLALLVAAGCSTESTLGPVEGPPSAQLGRTAFSRECAQCHSAADGFDLAFFSFTDTTIIRRAVKHVDTATARNIVAYIRSLAVPHASEGLRLFQPGNAVLGSDIEFAVTLFGQDLWPAGLTSAALKAIDPRQVRVALRLPVWSDESSNLDWMPDVALPAAILDHGGRQAEAAIAGYRAAPTVENLRRAVQALRVADRTPDNPGAPCLLEDPARVRYLECFEVRRWTSTLVAQHMLRQEVTGSLGSDLHDVWWDVGNAARKSRADPSQTVSRVNENWATWMFLGWSFDPSRHPSVYTGGGLRSLGLNRHATFVALRSEVARPVNSPMVYDDLVQAVVFSPGGWTAATTAFGLRHLLERLAAGDRPTRPEQRIEAAAAVNRALMEAAKKVPLAERAALNLLAEQVLAGLGQ